MKKKVEENWAKTAVVYQLYPRSFKDSNGDGVGDLNGIREKLDYLNDGTKHSLGINAIWLSPIYLSPMRDFGYDISDHCAIDPLFGTLKDFDLLVKDAHKRGIKVLMDFIPGHTSLEHRWFRESKSSRSNPKRDWYIWKDAKPDGSPPNNWVGVFGGSRWEWDEKTKQYYLHTFLKEQPDLNWRNPEVKKAMLDVLHFWLKRGVDGFRVDSFNDVYKDKRFLDEPINPKYVKGKDDPFYFFKHIYTRNQPERNTLVTLFGNVLKQYGDKFMLTESYVDLSEMIHLYEAGDRSHAPFNFKFIFLKWEAKEYKKFLDEYHRVINPEYLHTYVLGNHDRKRVVSRIGEQAARVAAMLQLTMRGMPIIYYGEELGMADVAIPADKVQDPFNLSIGDMQLGRDPQRTPMQWSTEKHAGFSTKDPWLPIANNYKSYSVTTEQSEPTSMLALYKTLIQYRQQSQALLSGTFQSIETKNKHILAYIRESEKEKILIILNFSSKIQSAALDFPKAKIICNTSLTAKKGQNFDPQHATLSPHEGYLLQIC